MVTWSNANAYYRNGGQGCGACTPVSIFSISTSTVPSHELAKEAAIFNISMRLHHSGPPAKQ